MKQGYFLRRAGAGRWHGLRVSLDARRAPAVIAYVLMLQLFSAPAFARGACPVPGHAVQWIADYCLYKEQTDDLVAAGPCIDEEQAKSDRADDCATKLHYKTELCALHISDRSRDGPLADCVGDKTFSGNTVHDDRQDRP